MSVTVKEHEKVNGNPSSLIEINLKYEISTYSFKQDKQILDDLSQESRNTPTFFDNIMLTRSLPSEQHVMRTTVFLTKRTNAAINNQQKNLYGLKCHPLTKRQSETDHLNRFQRHARDRFNRARDSIGTISDTAV